MTLTDKEIKTWTKFRKDFNYLIEMKDELTTQFQNISHALTMEVDRLSLGTCSIYLISILNNLRAVELALEHGFIESGATIAASVWEKCITLIFILNDPIARSLEHTSHQGFKKTPWTVKQMVKDIVNNETLHPSRNKDIEEQLLYFQYSYLCATKHGNPYTITYLNRFKENDTSVIDLKPEIVEEDNGLVALIFGISITSALDALIAFSKVFCELNKYKQLKSMSDRFTSRLMPETNNRQFKVPMIILPAPSDFTPEYWGYLKKLNELYFRKDNGQFS